MKLKLFKILLYPIYYLCIVVVFSFLVIKYKLIPHSEAWYMRQKIRVDEFFRNLDKDR